jgi:hypothetical protein
MKRVWKLFLAWTRLSEAAVCEMSQGAVDSTITQTARRRNPCPFGSTPARDAASILGCSALSQSHPMTKSDNRAAEAYHAEQEGTAAQGRKGPGGGTGRDLFGLPGGQYNPGANVTLKVTPRFLVRRRNFF